jgi:hypothetical protein
VCVCVEASCLLCTCIYLLLLLLPPPPPKTFLLYVGHLTTRSLCNCVPRTPQFFAMFFLPSVL